jgi:hypothetical protein
MILVLFFGIFFGDQRHVRMLTHTLLILYSYVTHTLHVMNGFFSDFFYAFSVFFLRMLYLNKSALLVRCSYFTHSFFFPTHSAPQQKSSFFFALCPRTSFFRQSQTNQLALSVWVKHAQRMSAWSRDFFFPDKVQQISWLSLLHSLMRCACFTHSYCFLKKNAYKNSLLSARGQSSFSTKFRAFNGICWWDSLVFFFVFCLFFSAPPFYNENAFVLLLWCDWE